MHVTRKKRTGTLSRATRGFVLGSFGAGVGALSGVISTMLFNDAPLRYNAAMGATSGALTFLLRGMSPKKGVIREYALPAGAGFVIGTPFSFAMGAHKSSAFVVGFNTAIANWAVPLLERSFPHDADDNNPRTIGKPFLQLG